MYVLRRFPMKVQTSFGSGDLCEYAGSPNVSMFEPFGHVVVVGIPYPQSGVIPLPKARWIWAMTTKWNVGDSCRCYCDVTVTES
jgi:hypothetical protein